ncbi:MAG: response regulator [Ferruginibacter sp.]
MKNLHVLLIEDNEGDILLASEALEEGLNIKNISVAKNGKDAVLFFKSNKDNAKDLPDIVLLDINLPIKNGFEVLEYIRNTEELENIPVIILTTSSLENDKNTAKNYGANLYIIKPMEAAEYETALENIKEFWINFKNNSSK